MSEVDCGYGKAWFRIAMVTQTCVRCGQSVVTRGTGEAGQFEVAAKLRMVVCYNIGH